MNIYIYMYTYLCKIVRRPTGSACRALAVVLVLRTSGVSICGARGGVKSSWGYMHPICNVTDSAARINVSFPWAPNVATLHPP